MLDHLFTFHLTDSRFPLPGRSPFYTSTAATPQAAEDAAYLVYLKAVKCPHQFVATAPGLSRCQRCGVHLREVLPVLQAAAVSESASTAAPSPYKLAS